MCDRIHRILKTQQNTELDQKLTRLQKQIQQLSFSWTHTFIAVLQHFAVERG